MGMNIHELYAGMAMQGLIRDCGFHNVLGSGEIDEQTGNLIKRLAQMSFIIADAMMVELVKRRAAAPAQDGQTG
jgi:hypothetical protein